MTTAASEYGLRAVLTQLHEDNLEKTVAFASQTLIQTEKKYSTVEKETLAYLWATGKAENLLVRSCIQVAYQL